MKHIFTALVITLVFVSCYKYKVVDLNPNANNNGGTFTANIDGTSFTANLFATASINSGRITIAGKNTTGKLIALALSDYGVGNYPLIDTSLNAVAYTDSVYSNNSFGSNQWVDNLLHGNVNITTIDTTNKKISGTFTANVKMQLTGATRTITNGVFTNIPYTTTITSPGTTDTFRVKVDGVQFANASTIAVNSFGLISISGSAATSGNPTVGITVPSTTTVGTYTLSALTPPLGQYNSSSGILTSSSSGSVQILEHNTTTKRIRGNFSFVSNPITAPTPVYNLTEGYFSVKYL